MRIAIGCDHAGVDLKQQIVAHLAARGHVVADCGTDSREVTNYPLYAQPVCDAVLGGEADVGLLICGSGVGISIAANKVRGIRAVVCSEPYSAKLAREHNDANVLAFGARVVGVELAKMITEAFLEASFQHGIHVARLEMVARMERGERA